MALLRKFERHVPLKEKMTHALHGSLKPTDALLLRKIIRRYKPPETLEIGSFLGVSSRWILEASSSWEGHLTAIDPNIPHRVFESPRNFMEKLNKKFIPQRLAVVTAFFGTYGGTCMACLPPGKASQNTGMEDIPSINAEWDKKFDFIFIDGEHSYDAVMNNFEIAVRLLNKGGAIVFHDVLSREGVKNGLSDIRERYKGKAEVEILGERDRKLLAIIGRANDGIGVFTFYE